MLKHALGALVLTFVAGAATTALAQSNVTAHPNSQKYSDTGAKPATGRAGSASLEARALIAKDATVQVEASTGSLEDGTRPGNIDKMQVKRVTRETVVHNYNKLIGGGYFSVSYPAGPRGETIHLQANISGVDSRRTGVVTVSTPALLRPDVAVSSVSGPRKERSKVPVTFYATVAELNEDVGARADCGLSIDGTDVDAADGIWVDAAGVVTCEFTHVFDKPGKYEVKVAATNVMPGDWDMTNNSAATSIEIVNPDREIAGGNLRAGTHRVLYEQRFWRSGCIYGGYSCDYDTWLNSRNIHSYLLMDGWHAGLSAPVDHLDVESFANGLIQNQAWLKPVRVDEYSRPDDDFTANCAWYATAVVDANGEWHYSRDRFRMCSSGYKSNPQWGGTSFFYQQLEGHASYYSSYRACRDGLCSSWTSNSTPWTYGDGKDLGWTDKTVVRLKLRYVDRSGVSHTLDKSVTLSGQTPSEQTKSDTGSDHWGTWYSFNHFHHSWASGWIAWNDPH